MNTPRKLDILEVLNAYDTIMINGFLSTRLDKLAISASNKF